MLIPKYRAWHKESKHMYIVNAIDWRKQHEGDIVRSEGDEGYVYEKVIAEEGGAWNLECIHTGENHCWLVDCNQSVGVIGNVYQNAALLK